MEVPLSGLSVVAGTRICACALLVYIYLFIYNIADFYLNLRHTFIRISTNLGFYEAFYLSGSQITSIRTVQAPYVEESKFKSLFQCNG
jgi:hypothetical protein